MNNMHTQFIILFLLGLLPFWSTASLDEFVKQWANSDINKSATVSLSVHHVKSGKPELGYLPDKNMVPASSLKVFASFISLNHLSEDFRFTTRIAKDGFTLGDGTHYGNIYLIASGDPSFLSGRFPKHIQFDAFFDKTLQIIKSEGIACVEGSFFIVLTDFDGEPVDKSWQWGDIGNYYGAGHYGFNFLENEYSIDYFTYLSIGSQARTLHIYPAIPGLRIESQVTVAKEGSGDNAYIFGDPMQYQRVVKGTLGRKSTPFRIYGSTPNPPESFARLLHQFLEISGIRFYEITPRYAAAPLSIKTLWEHQSPKLSELALESNSESLNLYSEAFASALATYNGFPGSRAKGLEIIKHRLGELKIDTSQLQLIDASGLSVKNLVSTRVLSSFITKMAQNKGVEFMLKHLPKAGKEGTVKSMLRDTPAEGKVWMKSGSLSGVISYTGLVQAKNKEWYSFSVIINNSTTKNKELRKEITKLLVQLYEHL
jgi:serine-type D-Ala-D-Ala carboxypeptidase/endopeptidase (penicillin-binding protein 4)